MGDKKNKTKLLFFTAEYPFFKGIGEPFIENEIGYLADAFTEVIIFPYNKTGASRDVPSNIKIGNLSFTSKITFIDIFLIIKILLYEFSNVKNRMFFLKKIRMWASVLKKAVLSSKSLENIIRSENNTELIYYSYWMNEWALVLAILKHRGIINNFVFRCGGYDIWDERHEGNYLPFRYYIYNKTSGIYPNSKMGEKYLKAYNHYADKIKCLYWGTKDKGLNPFDVNEIPCIVSCSSLIPLKRVDRIIDVLKWIDLPLKWVHFGDGPLKHDLHCKIKTLPKNISVEFKGNITNDCILDYYITNSITCFISTSSTESMPVSIQEAISFGIPVIATNVGGVSEMVNNQTGLLLNANFEEKEVARIIKKMIFDPFPQIEYRKKIKQFWLENFNAANTYKEFVKILQKKR